MSVLQSFIDYALGVRSGSDEDEFDEEGSTERVDSVNRNSAGEFTNFTTHSMWLAWQTSRKKVLEEFDLKEHPITLRAAAVQFVADNLKTLVIERSEKTPDCLPKKALFLKAASLFLESDVGMSDDTAYAAVDTEINTLCMNYVKENLK